MRAAILLVLLPALCGAAGFEQFTRADAVSLLLRQLRQAPAEQRVALGPETDYWSTSVFFSLADGRLVRISGNKDRAQGDHDGYFMSFLADGRSEPVWVAPDRKPMAFVVEGDTYTVTVLVGGVGIFHPLNDIKLMRHPEGIRIRLAKPSDPSFKLEFTAGQLVNAMRQTGRRVQLGGRVYYANYVRDIKEVQNPAAPVAYLPRHTVWLLPEMQPQTDSKGNVNYKFGWGDRIEIRAEDAEGVDAAGNPRLARPTRKNEDGETVPLPYSFHLEDGPSGKVLVVSDAS